MSNHEPPYPGDPGGIPPYGADGHGYADAVPQQNKKALWSLVLGLLSMFCCGVLTGGAAIVLATLARKEIAASGGRQTGSGMATAGLVLGILGVVLTLVGGYLVATGTIEPWGGTPA